MKKLISLFMIAVMLMSVSTMAETLMGGWTPSASPEITEDVQAVFDKAMEGLIGVNYVPVAFLGSQVVAGTNYCLLCQATVVYPDAQPYYVLMYLYQDLSGNVEIMNIADLDLGYFAQYGE